VQKDPSANEPYFSRAEALLDLVDVIRRRVAVVVDKSDNSPRCGAPAWKASSTCIVASVEALSTRITSHFDGVVIRRSDSSVAGRNSARFRVAITMERSIIDAWSYASIALL